MFDTAGAFIIIVLISLFSFLTARAWKAKNAILKWGGMIIAGLQMTRFQVSLKSSEGG
jgi:hypothetical protein